MKHLALGTIYAAVFALGLSAVTWTEVAHWYGNGTKDTETFTTTQREWRIRWTLAGTTARTIFDITVKDPDGKRIANVNSKASGETTIRTPAGRYYLAIASANAEWTITAEEPHE